MTHINATATRCDGWWSADFTINNREYGTQARRLDQLEAMIKDAAALMTGQPEETFAVTIEPCGLPLEAINRYKNATKAAQEAEQELSASSRAAVRFLTQAGLSMRDIGSIMGVSVQRVSQLAKA